MSAARTDGQAYEAEIAAITQVVAVVEHPRNRELPTGARWALPLFAMSKEAGQNTTVLDE